MATGRRLIVVVVLLAAPAPFSSAAFLPCLRVAAPPSSGAPRRVRAWGRGRTTYATAGGDDEGDAAPSVPAAAPGGSKDVIPPSSPPRPSPPPREITTSQLLVALGTSPRRIFLSLLSGTGIALAGNLFGITSTVLSALPESTVESTGLDSYYPRGGFKRYRSPEGYSFVVPKEWVADTALELAKATRKAGSLDYGMRRGGGGTLPDAAFGPPGNLDARGRNRSDTNASVVVSKVPGLGTSLRAALGPPDAAAEVLLRTSLAPPGSGRTATLVSAFEEARPGRSREAESGTNGTSTAATTTVYQFEYDVDRSEKGAPTLRAISVVAVGRGGDSLVTMTVVAPLSEWKRDPAFDAKLRRVAGSFKLTQ